MKFEICMCITYANFFLESWLRLDDKHIVLHITVNGLYSSRAQS